MADPSHFSTIEPFLDAENYPGWVDGTDRVRIAAYDVYEAIYWTAPDTFKLTMRGQEGTPIYVPSGRKVVETANRYLANDFEVFADPEFGTDAEQTQAMEFFTDFARRERLFSKFNANKRMGLIRGDWLWHIFGDDTRIEGARISIAPLDPATYFPEYDDNSNLIAVHLVESTLDSAGDPAVRKLLYSKETGAGGPSPILVSDIMYGVEEWGQPGTDMPLGRRLQVFQDEERLPDPISSIPIYHVPNIFGTEDVWGSSEMRGIERLLSAINQAITDEELSLVMEGLGVYFTDAGAPIDEETGEEVPWNLGPARVVELPEGKKFGRVPGATTIGPYQDHLTYLHRQVDDSTGTNDVTRGSVDVAVAESGVALMLRMAPLLFRMAEKELTITDVHVNMLFDLRNWFAAFEGLNLDSIRWIPRYGNKLPVNKKEKFDQVMALYTAQPPVISAQEARRMLLAVGFDFRDDTTLAREILDEQANFARVQADAEAVRLGVELGEPTPA